MKFAFLTGAVVASLLVPTALAAQTPNRPPVRADGALVDTLRAVAFQMMDLLRNRDARGVKRLYADTLHFVHIEDGHIIPWSQLSPMMTSYLDSVSSNPITIVGEPGVTIIDRDNAVLYITHRFEGGPGREPHEGVWTGVMHRFPAGWRIIHSHSSDRTP